MLFLDAMPGDTIRFVAGGGEFVVCDHGLIRPPDGPQLRPASVYDTVTLVAAGELRQERDAAAQKAARSAPWYCLGDYHVHGQTRYHYDDAPCADCVPFDDYVTVRDIISHDPFKDLAAWRAQLPEGFDETHLDAIVRFVTAEQPKPIYVALTYFYSLRKIRLYRLMCVCLGLASISVALLAPRHVFGAVAATVAICVLAIWWKFDRIGSARRYVVDRKRLEDDLLAILEQAEKSAGEA
jgi:hypothetical protein